MKLILEDIPCFMKQLGDGFCFIDYEYKIKIGDKDNYIDKHVKSVHHDKTIGIIIAKKDNKFILEYCSDDRIFSSSYNLV